jgi:hypothetical protein
MKLKTDYTTDQNPRSIHFVQDQGITPEYIKSAAVPTKESVQGMPDTVFADPGKRLLPVHTKEATFFSAAYFFGSGDSDPSVATRIEKAAAAFGITSDIVNVRNAFVFETKQASAVPYALEVEMSKEAGVHSFYPLLTRDNVVDSASQMSRDYHEGRLPLELYRDAAVNTVKSAHELGIEDRELPKTVVQLGTPRTPDFQYAASRVSLSKSAGLINEEALPVYLDILQAAESEYNSISDFTEKDAAMTKWAEAMLDLDRACGIAKYNEIVVDPYSALFSGTSYADIDKAASETLFINDAAVPLAALQAIPSKDVHARFTKDESASILDWQKSASAYDINRELGLQSEAFHDELLRLAVKYG